MVTFTTWPTARLQQLDQRPLTGSIDLRREFGDDRPSRAGPSGALAVAEKPARAKTAIHPAQLRRIARGASGDQPHLALGVTVTIDRRRDDLPQLVDRQTGDQLLCSLGVSDRVRAALPDIGQSLDERSWRDDRDPDVVELDQIAVAGHERVDEGRSRQRDEVVVVGIAADSRMGRGGSATSVITAARSARNRRASSIERSAEAGRDPEPRRPRRAAPDSLTTSILPSSSASNARTEGAKGSRERCGREDVGLDNPQPPRREMRPFDPDGQLEALAAELGPRYGPMVLFAAATGLRPGEWVALEHRDIDLDNRLVHVRRTFRVNASRPPRPTPRAPCRSSDRRSTRSTNSRRHRARRPCSSRHPRPATSTCTTGVRATLAPRAARRRHHPNPASLRSASHVRHRRARRSRDLRVSCYMGTSLINIDRTYGHLARDSHRHAIELLDGYSCGYREMHAGGRSVDSGPIAASS